MGIINKGILGGFSGNVGPVVGSTWKGITYMKSLPNKKSKTSTVKQIEQQLKFALIMRFTQTMTALLELTYKAYANGMTAFNAAFAYNIQNAVTGNSPDFEVDYQKVLVSRGSLPNGANPAVAKGTDDNLVFTWTDNSGMGKALATDKTVLVIYCSALDVTVYTSGNTTRDAGTETVDLSAYHQQTVETWIAFTDMDGNEASNSFYTGSIIVGS
ncbi:MAG TPA: DUF6266 family protein [Panacibacter sp.]|nr:DUF6266 family protein [Panacibacter sp.]HNP46519.1 DUF6266 family protein [Panacibacter sp.]